MARQAKAKVLEAFDNNHILELLAFNFKFSITGSYSTWEVWSNGKERSNHKPLGSFGGVIQRGRILKVEFKIWDGSYEITYDCKTGTQKNDDSTKPSPLKGQAMGATPANEVINIRF